jgi:alpha-galactosidase
MITALMRGRQEINRSAMRGKHCLKFLGVKLIIRIRYATMGKALNQTGRPILYSLCNWGEDYPWNWGSTTANSWRITGDVYDSWDRPDARCPW